MDVRIAGEPYRLSQLNSLAKCSGLVAARAIETDSVSSAAADTGTATGRGQELWHRGKTLDVVLQTLQEEQEEHYPLARMDEVLKVVTRYCNDPRNPPEVVVTRSLEQEVTLTIPPHPSDPTGQPYVATGHMDQVRYAYPYEAERENMGFYVWDAKNGKAQGEEMLGNYAFQLAAYAVAASKDYPGIMAGGIIRTQGYLSRVKDSETRKLRDALPGEHKVFFHAGWDLDDCHGILRTVSYLIGQIRAGSSNIPHLPGPHCRYCPLDFPSCTADGVLQRQLQRSQR